MSKKRNYQKIIAMDEEQRLLDWTQQNRSFRDYVVILAILRTGLRVTELRELLVSDISADGEIFTQLEVRGEIAYNHKPHSVSIPKELRKQFWSFLEWKQQNGDSVEPMSFLFTSAKSPQISVRHLQRIVRDSTIGALGKPYSARDLRRTWEARHWRAQSHNSPATTVAGSDKPKSEQNVKSPDSVNSTLGEVEIVQPKQGAWQTYDVTDGLPGQITSMMQDRQGYLWLGGSGWLCRYDGAEFITYTTAEELANNYVRSICEDHQGRLWFGIGRGHSSGGGAACFDGQDFIIYTTADGLADNNVWSIYEDHQKRLWFGTDSGVSCFDGANFITYTTADGLAGNHVYVICEDHPPLRERLDDIPLLAAHFYKEACSHLNKMLNGLAPGVVDMLQNYSWPGNVRELRNEIRRAYALAEEGLRIQPYHFSSQVTRGESLIPEIIHKGISYSEAVDNFRRQLIIQKLKECDGNRHEAARRLRMHRPNLIALIKRLGIKSET